MDLIEIPVPAGSAEAYVARPPGGGGGSGVLLLMDALGVRPRLAEMADRMASWGHVVLVPNVFHREGRAADLAPAGDLVDAASRDAFFAQAVPRIGRLTTDLALPDLDAYVDALRGLDGVGAGPVGVVGYCMGVRLAMRVAGSRPDDVAACAGFHGGGLVTDAPDSPHLALATARAEVLLGHADHDPSLPPEAVVALDDALASYGLAGRNEVYAGAGHGYTMADTAVFDEAATERHFAALEDLFARRLGHAAV